MDFGKLPDVSGIDHTLPPDAPENASVLSGKPAKAPIIIIGTPSWNHPEWIGKVYAPGKKSREFLPEYTHQFNGIEVNATAYNMPAEAKIEAWRAAATPGFKFCIKFPQTVTHYGSPLGKLDLIKEFVARTAPLAEHLGPPILQFAERFGPKSAPDLHEVLRQYATYGGPPLSLELRHPDYFVGDNRAWLDWLQQLGQVAIITDTSGRRDVLHMRLTSPSTLIRFNGNNLHPTDFQRLDEWADRIATWLSQGLEEAYFFVHTAPKLNCPELANYFADALSQRTGIKLQKWVTPPSLV